MTRYRLVIDEEACWGCRTCEVACQQEFGLSQEVPYIRVVEDGPKIVNGRPEFTFKVRVCEHCDAPPCAEACAEEAIEIRDDGIVVLNREKCIGCGLCAEECPFGAITFDPESGIAQKCNLCFQRIDSGLLPACADNICLAHCIHLGTNE